MGIVAALFVRSDRSSGGLVPGFIFACLFTFCLLLTACQTQEENRDYIEWPDGQFNQTCIKNLRGFNENKVSALAAVGMTNTEFISWSTDSAWALSETKRTKLKLLRQSISAPTGSTLLSKVIPLQDVATYMNNTYGGTVGGFVCVAADAKRLTTMHDVYFGLRLDYSGTKFLPDGAGYAVIRFTSNNTGKIIVPFCVEMGGTNAHAWPSTGGGFTSSTLGEGGYPEYTFSNYYAPNQGAELYEVTPLGNEILRATFQENKWISVEPEIRASQPMESTLRNGQYGWSGTAYTVLFPYAGGKQTVRTESGFEIDYTGPIFYIASYCDYQGFTFRAWYADETHYFLTTSNPEVALVNGFEVLERSVFGRRVLKSETTRFQETIRSDSPMRGRS